ncbi:MAG: T9SS type A sorting domain-containing protein [Flavobacteriales bacterium]|nr:T9SS type A sorting domain-containing protein [Flavobacteriales bacterium]
MFNILREQILSKTTNQKELLLDLSNYLPGVYFLQIKSRNVVDAQKIILSN